MTDADVACCHSFLPLHLCPDVDRSQVELRPLRDVGGEECPSNYVKQLLMSLSLSDLFLSRILIDPIHADMLADLPIDEDLTRRSDDFVATMNFRNRMAMNKTLSPCWEGAEWEQITMKFGFFAHVHSKVQFVEKAPFDVILLNSLMKRIFEVELYVYEDSGVSFHETVVIVSTATPRMVIDSKGFVG